MHETSLSTIMRSLALLLCVISAVNGSLDERIVAGRNFSDNPVPSMVRIMISNSLQCGGTIINDRYILTGAQCIDTENRASYTIVAGTKDRNKGGVTYLAEEFILHPSYRPSKKINDIGLIRVNRDIMFTSTIQPITLQSNTYVPVEEYAFLVGWGDLDKTGKHPVNLLLGYTQVMSLSQCENRLGGKFPSTKYICTQMIPGQALCSGDSGSPLIYKNAQIGIAAYVQAQCAPGLIDVYTMVSPYVPWIQSVSGKINTIEISGSNPVNHVNTWILLSLTILTLLSYSYSLS